MKENSETAHGVESTIHVTGMSCDHCVAAVTDELSSLDGVTEVDVVLVKDGISTATVHSEQPLEASAVAAAIDEAGYVLAP